MFDCLLFLGIRAIHVFVFFILMQDIVIFVVLHASTFLSVNSWLPFVFQYQNIWCFSFFHFNASYYDFCGAACCIWFLICLLKDTLILLSWTFELLICILFLCMIFTSTLWPRFVKIHFWLPWYEDTTVQRTTVLSRLTFVSEWYFCYTMVEKKGAKIPW